MDVKQYVYIIYITRWSFHRYRLVHFAESQQSPMTSLPSFFYYSFYVILDGTYRLYIIIVYALSILHINFLYVYIFQNLPPHTKNGKTRGDNKCGTQITLAAFSLRFRYNAKYIFAIVQPYIYIYRALWILVLLKKTVITIVSMHLVLLNYSSFFFWYSFYNLACI